MANNNEKNENIVLEINEIISDVNGDSNEHNCPQFSKISEITLEYLMNKRDYRKYQNKKNINAARNISKDKAFYQKRINDLTRYFMNRSASDEDERYYPDYVVISFNNYLDTLIEYFKMIDKTDIIQEDYVGLRALDNFEIDKQDDQEYQNKDSSTISCGCNKSLFFKQTIAPSSLFSNFIKVTKTKEDVPKVYPLQREIQLDNPTLKTKGVTYHKHNNITINNNIINKYEKTYQNTETDVAFASAEAKTTSAILDAKMDCVELLPDEEKVERRNAEDT